MNEPTLQAPVDARVIETPMDSRCFPRTFSNTRAMVSRF